MVSDYKEHEEEQIAPKTVKFFMCSGTCLGLICFAFVVFQSCILNLYYFYGKNAHSVSPMSGQAFFVGGLGQVIAGIMCYYQNDIFHASAFTSFGLNWMGRGLTGYIYDISFIFNGTTKVLARTSPTEAGIVTLTWSFWVIVLFLSKFRSNLSTFLMLLFLNIHVHTETIGVWLDNRAVIIISAITGIITASLALYNGSYDLFEDKAAFSRIYKGRGPFEHKV
ncbi:hypothetical protein BB560_004063 [Smittium megazygosporum]|uniref:Uncharacterized protein n=1 Tax=Smittium megazygosporum TaxID=133381 RepID=A0A2T9ZAF8_9FUNG|nr:hypothetical protein BB560_005438 [Smittium megazygosporum]PVV01517.1 hypothetical protein BB560_004063 [Smittium megazygosporum]